MYSQAPHKILFMGLGASGKSSIRSVVFEGKSPEEVKNYDATINYFRSAKTIIDAAIQIFDCGGQENFISAFIGDQAEFMFTNVKILCWVVDVGDPDQISTSKFYFDHAVNRLIEYSPESIIFCLFHKIDLLLPEMVGKVEATMKRYFNAASDFEVYYFSTSIFTESVYHVMGEIIRKLIIQSGTVKTVSEAIQNFVNTNTEISGMALYTEEGLPVLEEGFLSQKIVLPANLWLSNKNRLRREFNMSDTYKTALETNNYLLISQVIKGKENLLIAGIAEKTVPIQFLMAKIDQFAAVITDLL
ncbi:MAG: ADP-ribosylation factor-like protein [Candidatus Thorarchaeota archaeon]